MFDSLKKLFEPGESNIPWKSLDSAEKIDTIIARSKSVPVAIYKHSTLCGISSSTKARLEHEWDLAEDQIEIYFLDIIANRDLSNRVSEEFGVRHESPQMLLIKDGEAVFDASHIGVSVSSLRRHLN